MDPNRRQQPSQPPADDAEGDVAILEAETGDEHEDDGQGTAEGGDAPEGEVQQPGAEGAGGGGDDDGEVVITIGDDPPEQDAEENRAPAWVRDLRKSNREKDRRIRELEQRVAAAQPAAGATAAAPGARPKLEDHDYDAEAYEKALDAWLDRKAAYDRAQEEKAAAEKAQRDAWQATLDGYEKAKRTLKVPDFDDAEETARDLLSVTQQGVILAAAEDAAKVVYALGRNPTAARRMAAITDPVKFAAAVGRLEAQLKVTIRGKAAPPPPERVVRSAVAGAAAVDNTLEKLREEAAKTGDMSKVLAYRRQLKAKQGA